MIKLLNTHKVNIHRPKKGHWVEGHYYPAPSSKSLDIKCNIQPLSGQELLQLDEGDRVRTQLWMYSIFETKINDIILHEGIKYEVQLIEPWIGFCARHYKARIVKLDKQDEQI